jgi:hypothetical protein
MAAGNQDKFSVQFKYVFIPPMFTLYNTPPSYTNTVHSLSRKLVRNLLSNYNSDSRVHGANISPRQQTKYDF